MLTSGNSELLTSFLLPFSAHTGSWTGRGLRSLVLAAKQAIQYELLLLASWTGNEGLTGKGDALQNLTVVTPRFLGTIQSQEKLFNKASPTLAAVI